MTVIFDKSRRKIIFKQKNLIRKKLAEYDLNSLQQVELRQFYVRKMRSGGKNIYKVTYTLSFIFNNEAKLVLKLDPPSFISTILSFLSLFIGLGGERVVSAEDVGPRIADFLHVPFKEIRDTPDVRGTIIT